LQNQDKKKSTAISSQQYSDTLSKKRLKSFPKQETFDVFKSSFQSIVPFDNLFDEIEKLIHFERALIYVYSDYENRPLLVANRGILPDKISTISRLNGDLLDQILISKKPLLITDKRKKTAAINLDQNLAASLLYVPVFKQQQCFGIIGLESDKTNNFSAEHQAILTSIAEIAIHTLENLTTNLKSDFQAKLLSILYEISSCIGASQSIEDIFSKFYEQLGSVMDNNALFVGTFDENSNTFNTVFNYTDDKNQSITDFESDSFILEKIKREKKSILNNLSPDNYQHEKEQYELLYPSSIFAPLILEDKIVGIVSVFSRRYNAYNEYQQKLLTVATNQLAVHVERKQLSEKLKIEKEKIENILNSLDKGIVIISRNQIVQYVNQWMNNKIKKDIIGKSCSEALQDLNIPCEKCSLCNQGELKFKLFEVKGKDDQFYQIEFFPLKYSSGELNILLFINDITKKKKYDKKTIETEKLKAVVNLAGAISHELGQPLTGITCYTSLMLEDIQEGDKFFKEITEIDNQTTRMEQLIKKFQKITRYEKKSYVEDHEILDIDKSFSE